MNESMKKNIAIGLGILLAGLLVSVPLSYLIFAKRKKFESVLGIYENAAVSAFGPECSQIGTDVLLKNGSATDAAIAALLCEEIASPHSMGLGGGVLMTIYNAETRTADFIDARETAPGRSHRDIYVKNPENSFIGGKAVATPGALLGYWEAHRKYGRLPWRQLFEGPIELCENGTLVNDYLENSLRRKEDYIWGEPSLKDVFVNPETNRLYRKGERIRRPTLKKTLIELANSQNPVELFYKGRIANNLVRELKAFGGIITKQDFLNYKARWMKPVELKLEDNRTIYSAPPSGCGAILLFILNVLQQNQLFKSAVNDNNKLWQRIVETLKWAYARRTELGDPGFEEMEGLLNQLTSQEYANKIRRRIKDSQTSNEPKHYGVNYHMNLNDYGTTHVCVLAQDGSAVSATATVNNLLGAKIRSRSTGIIFNNQMRDFSTPGMSDGFGLPPSRKNFIVPGKRPMSSMAPTIALDADGEVELVIGAAGGSRIVSSLATIMAFILWKNCDVKEATDAERLHHQLIPMEINYEPDFPSDVIKFLRDIGHKTVRYDHIGSVVNLIRRNATNGTITANSDWRRQGTTAGF